MTIKNHRLVEADYQASPNKGGKITPRFIVMHYTAGYTARSAVTTLTRKGSNVSAHVVVDFDGTITQLVPFNVKAWHAGPSAYQGYTGLNSYAIGIEIVNIGWMKQIGNGRLQDAYGRVTTEADWPNGLIYAPEPRVGSGEFAWPVYPEAQLAAVEWLTEQLVDKYSIMDIVTHQEIDTRGWKTDPGPAFPMQRFKAHLTSDRGVDEEVFEVTATSLNVRGGPGTQFAPIGTLQQHTRVSVMQQQGVWAQVTSDGWVHSSYLRRV